MRCACLVVLLCSVAGAQPAPDSAQRAFPRVLLPRPERILLWSPQEKPVGFRNMEKVSPAHRVKRGRSVFPLPYAATELQVNYAHDGRNWDTTTFIEQNNVAGLIVVKNGRILLERYALGFDESSLWTSFSVAKSITSTLVGAAVADGHIRSIEAPVVQYLPVLKNTAYDGVTLRQILNMTSGVKWNEDYSDPESDLNRRYRATDRALGSTLLTYLAKLPREATPGAKWVYKTAESDLTGEVVIAATGKPLADYLSEKIWSEFGMERDAFWMIRDDKELGGCCLSMSLRDYARFAMFIMSGGRAGSKKMLPVGWTDQAFTATAASREAIKARGGQGGYGFQWWVETDGPGTYSAKGIFGQSIYLNPAENLIIVTLSAWPTALDGKRRDALLAYEQAVARSARSVIPAVALNRSAGVP